MFGFGHFAQWQSDLLLEWKTSKCSRHCLIWKSIHLKSNSVQLWECRSSVPLCSGIADTLWGMGRWFRPFLLSNGKVGWRSLLCVTLKATHWGQCQAVVYQHPAWFSVERFPAFLMVKQCGGLIALSPVGQLHLLFVGTGWAKLPGWWLGHAVCLSWFCYKSCLFLAVLLPSPEWWPSWDCVTSGHSTKQGLSWLITVS